MHTASSASLGISTDERQTRFHVPRCIRAAGPGKTRIRSGAPSPILPAPAQTSLARQPLLDAGHRPSHQHRCCTTVYFCQAFTDRQVAQIDKCVREEGWRYDVGGFFGVQERMVWLSLKSHHELTFGGSKHRLEATYHRRGIDFPSSVATRAAPAIFARSWHHYQCMPVCVALPFFFQGLGVVRGGVRLSGSEARQKPSLGKLGKEMQMADTEGLARVRKDCVPFS